MRPLPSYLIPKLGHLVSASLIKFQNRSLVFQHHILSLYKITVSPVSASSKYLSPVKHTETNKENAKAKTSKRTRTNGSLPFLPIFQAGAARRRAVLLSKMENKLSNKLEGSLTGKQLVPPSPLSIDGWKKLKDESINNSRFEVRMMEQMLSSESDINVAKSLLTFVAKESGSISYELLLKYLALCVNKNHTAEVYDVFDIMKVRFKSLETGAYSLLIKGLSGTDRWKECLTLLESLKQIVTPSSKNYGDAIFGAIHHKEATTGWELYEEMINKNLQPNLATLQTFFDYGKFHNDDNYKNKLSAVLLYLRDNQIYPNESLLKSIKSWFESVPGEKWKGSFTTINNSGECRSCQKHLESIQLSEDEYNELRTKVMKEVIEGRDVFKKTNPLELESFQKFVQKRCPYDVVIDGLNVANISVKGKRSQILLEVVSHLAEQNLRLLLLGRKHMLKGTNSWERRHMAAIQEKADCFFTENISEDDPFLLYATLYSGNHCKFLSRDLMRDHKACLSDGIARRLFFKWQRGHQLLLSYYSPGKRIQFENVLNYDTIIQTTEDTWHIPYDEDEVERCSYEVPRKWLCLQKRD
ncbi:mitochondrial ribonuclease P catalytic subunit [Latimeria chalumnae]|uniref:mitochondrial ribonuclease P catalytic subunit n=1 Tax=Latimeria chalumnae TaxID=7897 RepID=UPI0006D9227A|nr:PREDICTED: mitochondrial ribonuclease P protein 3 [Latimeria chalumnae]|eukprot:XP_005989235.2 PREDICTED: mitochondrial ribonuclease P protein 3 [Latimeria chalumnae]